MLLSLKLLLQLVVANKLKLMNKKRVLFCSWAITKISVSSKNAKNEKKSYDLSLINYRFPFKKACWSKKILHKSSIFNASQHFIWFQTILYPQLVVLNKLCLPCTRYLNSFHYNCIQFTSYSFLQIRKIYYNVLFYENIKLNIKCFISLQLQ